MSTFTFHANLAATPLLNALNLLKTFFETGKRKVPNTAPTAFVSGKWQPYVFEDNGAINTVYYILCALWELNGALRGGNIWVEG